LLPSDPVTASCAAPAAVTVNVDEPPALIVAGFAMIVTVGKGTGAVTVTVAVAEAFPPAPETFTV
jgi:hypothetical protein